MSDLTALEQMQAKYPAQYYASLDKPCAWYNMWVYSSADNLPDTSNLYAMTADEWAYKGGDNGTRSMAVIDGKLQDYAQPAPVVPLQTQAATLLKSQQAYVMQNYAIYGDDTPAEWLTYLKALRAIANGTDTTSTTLPTQPTDIMTTS